MDSSEKELTLLEQIEHDSHVSQRDLAYGVGLSLGMTNAVLKRLVNKGLLMVQKVNNRNMKYIVTPKGLEAITRRSYRYFRRTLKNVAMYREAIEELVADVKTQGFDSLVLVGPSDLDFIVEWACEKKGIRMVKDDSQEAEAYLLYSESYIAPAEHQDTEQRRHAFLAKILLKESTAK